MDYGKRLKSLRDSRNLSQQELADRLQLNRSTYARYELNQTQPDLDTLKKIADFYDVSVDYIMERTDVRNPEKQPEGRFFFNLDDATEEDLEDLEDMFEILKRRKQKRENKHSE
ncbi:helix-turn-helix domain-containing protein [Sporolactobacillus shoreicorticis]|uniref:Helix-turn-helix domain-containing protein n=1 Tax=Sporolactobacillus shoreicorticis TaxID=1923877 RepID=A0ABW5S5P0_9BACL|nr:helix-turn-helix transcriptional regulator [Sporolactobacillus shoreicorticis]MCO7127764.1 helix-turn-helix domain-containing protein [Sporolactobacillus shoreicorticis]